MKAICVQIFIALLFIFPSLVVAQGNSEILINVTAENETTGVVKGLKAEDFEVKFGNVGQTVTSFQTKGEPASICILLDVSGSMNTKIGSTNSKLQPFLDGLEQFVNTSNDADEYFLATFNATTNLVVDKTQSRDLMIKGLKALRDIKTEGNTNFYDAVDIGLGKLATAKYKKRVLLIVSDGADNSSKISLGSLKQKLKTSEVLLYSVSIKLRGVARVNAFGGWVFLDEITFASGGRAIYAEKPADITASFDKISSELKNQYIIGFVPSLPKTGKWYKLKVAIKQPQNTSDQVGKISVRYRFGFIY